MIRLTTLTLILAIAGCAVCKPTDSVEICRTKQRNHSQRNSSGSDDS